MLKERVYVYLAPSTAKYLLFLIIPILFVSLHPTYSLHNPSTCGKYYLHMDWKEQNLYKQHHNVFPKFFLYVKKNHLNFNVLRLENTSPYNLGRIQMCFLSKHIKAQIYLLSTNKFWGNCKPWSSSFSQ